MAYSKMNNTLKFDIVIKLGLSQTLGIIYNAVLRRAY